jgi:hypothetical protein
MKQKDIVTIVFIIGFSMIISIFISNAVISSPKNRHQKVETVDVISPEFTTPDDKYFTKDSINPTQTVQIGGDTNQKPFSGN